MAIQPAHAAVLGGPGDDTAGLRRFNVAMDVLHFAQGVIMVALSSSFSLPIVANLLYFDEATRRLLSRA